MSAATQQKRATHSSNIIKFLLNQLKFEPLGTLSAPPSSTNYIFLFDFCRSSWVDNCQLNSDYIQSDIVTVQVLRQPKVTTVRTQTDRKDSFIPWVREIYTCMASLTGSLCRLSLPQSELFCKGLTRSLYLFKSEYLYWSLIYND